MKPFNQLTVADVPTLDSQRLGDLIAWADHNRLRIANIETMGARVEQHHRTMRDLRALGRAASERLQRLNLEQETRMLARSLARGVGR